MYLDVGKNVDKPRKIEVFGQPVGDLFLYSLIFAGIMAVLMAVVVVQDFCEAMINRIGML